MFDKIRRWLRFNLLYFGRPRWDTGISPPELKEFLESTPPGCALDVGCGTGTNLLTMAKYSWEVVGVDIAWLSVLRARSKLTNAGFKSRVIHGDVTGNLGLKCQFDLVLDIGCYHSLFPEGRRNYRLNLASWLKPGGTYLQYAHLRKMPHFSHGIDADDMCAFQNFLELQWSTDSSEKRAGEGSGYPSRWSRFEKARDNGPSTRDIFHVGDLQDPLIGD